MKFRRKLGFKQATKLFNYNPNAGILTWAVDGRSHIKKGKEAGSIDACGYRQVMVDGISYLVHRVVWLLYYGKWPECQLDHDNQIRDDNRIVNLGKSNKEHNAKNTKLISTNTSGCMGVSWLKRKRLWMVRIAVKGNRLFGGCFKSKQDAIARRKEMEKQYDFNANHGRS